MSDKELLELAAKAAGYEDIDFECEVKYYAKGYDENGAVIAWWNPLTDDGDALRLAVKLGLDISIRHATVFVTKEVPIRLKIFEVFRPVGDDPFLATRRAIVRAAAAIGQEMP